MAVDVLKLEVKVYYYTRKYTKQTNYSESGSTLMGMGPLTFTGGP